jgi:hypothetical protein
VVNFGRKENIMGPSLREKKFTTKYQNSGGKLVVNGKKNEIPPIPRNKVEFMKGIKHETTSTLP